MRTVSRIIVTVVVGWAAVVVLSGCASIFGLSSVPQVSSDPATASSAAPSKAAAVEFCENDFSATYQRGMVPDILSIGDIELTNIGTTDCTLVGSPALAFSKEGDTTPEQAYAPYASITDAYHRGRTPIVVPPQGKAYVWTLTVAHGERGGDECPPSLLHKVTAIQVQLPGASKWITATANFEKCLRDSSDLIKIGPIDSKPRTPTKGL